MKTLYKTYNQKQARAKQIELESRYDVKWDFFYTGIGFRFTPIVTKETPEDFILALRLFSFLDSLPLSFCKLAEMSGLTLEGVLIAAKTLVKDGSAICGVNRNGNFSSIRIK